MKLTRRDFLKLSASTALLASLDWDHVVKAALSTIQKGKYNIIWFEAQSCTGDTGSLLLATDPNVIQVLAGHLHVVGPGAVALLYHDAVMPQWGEE
ncbi:MAG: twin-arginine translocation signal domain-containing protein, partial [Acidilobaceae archaeon]